MGTPFASAPVAMPSNPSNHLFTGEYYAETPNQPGQYFANSHYAGAPGISQTPNGTANGSIPPTPGTANGSIPPTPGSLAGRKRSRGDIFAEEEEEEDLGDGSVTTPHDSAMPSTDGTWGGDRRPFELGHIKRPSMSSRKSMRKDASAATNGSDDLANLLVPSQIREAAAEPLIDEATRALGISWARMDSTEALRINKAAYSKWIQAHYPGLKDVEIWLENSALPGYLVQARNIYSGQQGYYIFSHDLTEARLVTTEPADLVGRLRMLPALHLAAPGGHIRAETDPITAVQNEVNAVQGAPDGNEMSKFSHEVAELRDSVHGSSPSSYETGGMCSAHAMELD